jgi:hypothetical protein
MELVQMVGGKMNLSSKKWEHDMTHKSKELATKLAEQEDKISTKLLPNFSLPKTPSFIQYYALSSTKEMD